MEKVIRYTLKKTTVGLVSAAIAGSAIMVGPMAVMAESNTAEEEAIAVTISLDDHNEEEVFNVRSWTANTIGEIKAEIDRQLAEEVTEEEEDMNYVIQWGDTVWGITNAFEIDQDQFVKVNAIENPDLIYAGDTVTLDVTKAIEMKVEAKEDTVKNTATKSVNTPEKVSNNKTTGSKTATPNNQKVVVNTPAKAETPAAPETPKAETPAAPETPKAETPAAPEVEAPVVPEAPEVEAPVVPEAPEVEAPVVPETPEVEEPVVPETPEVEEPVVPETPEVEEPVVPETPEVEEPVVPETPEVEEPVVPETPEVEEPVVPEPVITTEQVGKLINKPYKTIIKNDPNLNKGERVVDVIGKNGSVMEITEITYKDGKKISSKVISTDVHVETIDEVVRIGTKVVEENNPTQDANLLNKELLSLINAERTRLGVSKLTYRAETQKGTDIRANEIVVSMGHTRPDGSSYKTAFDYIKGDNDVASEVVLRARPSRAKELMKKNNISYERASAEIIFSDYMDSPSHKGILTNPMVSSMTAGVYEDSSWIYNAIIFSF